jgi:hypothetical protein
MKTRTVKAYVEVFKRYENGETKRVFVKGYPVDAEEQVRRAVNRCAHRFAPCQVEVVRR